MKMSLDALDSDVMINHLGLPSALDLKRLTIWLDDSHIIMETSKKK
jgi:hypothetical protein